MKHNVILSIVSIALSVLIVDAAHAAPLDLTVPYNPQVNPADFTTLISNPYLSLPVGKKIVYEAATDEGLERTEILIPGWTHEVMGIQTLVFWDRVYLNNQVVEDTRDYLAQHTNGDVWYFGEHVDNYIGGKLSNHGGSWIAGVDGAKPGIWMLAEPRVGDEFRNEYYVGDAEDITKILAIAETVTTPLGSYTGCIKTLDWTPLNQTKANKFYCAQAGGTVLEVDLPLSGNQGGLRSELVEVDLSGAFGQILPAAYGREGVVDIGSSSASVDNVRDDNRHKVSNNADLVLLESGRLQENSSGWSIAIMSGLILLILGILLKVMWMRK